MERPSDGIFYTREGRPFAFSWQLGNQPAYRLEPVTDLPGSLKVPVPADRLFTPMNLPAVLIVVSERGGGVSHFFQWLLNTQSRSNNSAGEAAKQGKPRAKGTVPHGWKKHSVGNAYQLLSTWGKKSSLRVVIDRTAGENREDDEFTGMLSEIASMVESQDWRNSGSKLICVTREVRKLRIDPLYSSLLSRGQACRLPHFSPPELSRWSSELVRKAKHNSLAVPDDLAKEVKRWIGGQPTLTQFFFRFVDERLVEWQDGDIAELFQQAGRYIRDHRPHIVDRWALDLRDLLEEPPIRDRLEIYASGGTKDPLDPDFDDEDARLFLAGWVGLNPDNQWGIRSLCHQQWAREILRG